MTTNDTTTKPFPHLTVTQTRMLEAVAAGRVRYLPGRSGCILDQPASRTEAKIYTLGEFVTYKVGELILAELAEAEDETAAGCPIRLTTWGELVLAHELGVAA